VDLLAHRRRGGRVLGLCGGYQMLGQVLADPEGIEGAAGAVPGLGLLEVETVLGREKRLALVDGVHVESGAAVAGYEIHLGRTAGPDCARPFARLGGREEGAVSADGRVAGTYLHGLFAADGFRRDWLAGLGLAGADAGHAAGVEATLDALADHLEAHLDVAGILALAR
jgi:adenosylcobyric acid synthase